MASVGRKGWESDDSSSIASVGSTSFSDVSEFLAPDSDDDELSDDPEPVHRPVVGLQPYLFEPEPEDVAAAVDVRVGHVEEEQGPPRCNNLNWCSCDNCQLQATELECRCCQEIMRVREKMVEVDGIKCITEHPGFNSLCLDQYVLQVAWLQYRQQYGLSHERKMRHISYRQLARWCWGFLGRDVRVVLPSCAVARIRAQLMPPGLEEDAEFRGFDPKD